MWDPCMTPPAIMSGWDNYPEADVKSQGVRLEGTRSVHIMKGVRRKARRQHVERHMNANANMVERGKSYRLHET